jgi:hypothetical protein
MKALFAKVRPGKWVWQRALMAVVVAGVAVLAFCWGRHGAGNRAIAQAPPGAFEPPPILVPASGSDYARRVVAFIHGNIPITREDLGEYLIARFGAERVEFLVNRRIIEHACKLRNITVSDVEVDAQLDADLKAFGGTITKDDFVNKILKRYNKSLYEWKEDVIRPKLALTKFCKDQVKVEEKDLQDAFEARFGEQMICRMIVLPKEMPKGQLDEIWVKVSRSEDEFNDFAKKQFIPQLAAEGGKIPPIHKHFGDKAIEDAAFALRQPGDVSTILEMPDKTRVILKLVQRQPANTVAKLSDERAKLYKDVFEIKLSQEIPKMFAQLRTQANPTILLRRDLTPEQQVREQLSKGAPPAPPVLSQPQPRGN